MANIIEVSHITPFTDDSPEYSFVPEYSLPLTFHDTFWLKLPPVERLYFYSVAEPNESLYDSVVPKLKHSLSLALRHFLPAAGTLTWPDHSPKPVILYRAPSDAVSLTIAESDSDLDVLSGYEPREVSLFRDLVPKLSVSATGASVISLQVTLFPKHSGFSIGAASNHAVLDGKSTSMLLKSWAHFCGRSPTPSSLPPELTPFFDRSLVRDPNALDMFYLNWWRNLSKKVSNSNGDLRADLKLFEPAPPHDFIPGLLRATFLLTRTDIANLRGKISSSKNFNNKELRLSSFVVSYSYAMVCLLKATEASGEDGRPAKVIAGVPGDLRRRSHPPLPENYFGNCVGFAANTVDAREANPHADLTTAAVMIAGMVSELEACKDITKGAEERYTKMLALFPAQFGGIVGSPKFGDYGVDFGWGLPSKVEMVSIDRSGSISLLESRDGTGGIEIGLALKKHEMEIFASQFLNCLN